MIRQFHISSPYPLKILFISSRCPLLGLASPTPPCRYNGLEYDVSWTMPQCVLCLRLIGALVTTARSNLHSTFSLSVSYSWYHHPGIIISVSSSRFHHLGFIFSVSSSRYHHLGIIISVSSSRYCHLSFIISISSSRYHHLGIVISVSSSLYHHLCIIISVSSSRYLLY